MALVIRNERKIGKNASAGNHVAFLVHKLFLSVAILYRNLCANAQGGGKRSVSRPFVVRFQPPSQIMTRMRSPTNLAPSPPEQSRRRRTRRWNGWRERWSCADCFDLIIVRIGTGIKVIIKWRLREAADFYIHLVELKAEFFGHIRRINAFGLEHEEQIRDGNRDRFKPFGSIVKLLLDQHPSGVLVIRDERKIGENASVGNRVTVLVHKSFLSVAIPYRILCTDTQRGGKRSVSRPFMVRFQPPSQIISRMLLLINFASVSLAHSR